MEVLLEVSPQRHVDERAAVRGQLHGGREAALDDGDVAYREVVDEVGQEPADLDAGHRG